jgi:predicted kinase
MTALDRAAFTRLLLAQDLSPLAAAVERGEADRLLPGLRAETDVPQRTRWHALSVLRHSAATAGLLPDDLETRATGLLHDLGKRASITINDKGDEQYIGHPDRGAAMAGAHLDALGMSPAARDKALWRIARHMDLHQAARDAVSAESLDRVLSRLGAEAGFMADLAVADTATMHPSIAADKLAEHAAFWDRLGRHASTRGIALPPRAVLHAAPHPAAAAAVRAGTAWTPLTPEQAAAARAAEDWQMLAALGVSPTAKTAKPVMLLFAGLPASGKSFLARAVAARVPHLAVLPSDNVRLYMSGGSPDYSGQESHRVFTAIRRLSVRLLAAGYSVAIDATSRVAPDRRDALSPGVAAKCPTVIAWCEVDEATAAARFARRRAGADSADRSQADAVHRARMAQSMSRPTPLEAGTVIIVTPETAASAVDRLVSIA